MGKWNGEKVIRGGKVAVLYSPGYGAGWYSWASGPNIEGMLFHPTLVKLVEEEKRESITEELVSSLLGITKDDYIYVGSNVEDLEIEWIPKGCSFEIEEYDGSEDIHIIGERKYHTA